ncbi:hypothetical protein D915_010484 [Fasciola hepatica]|uniref:Uncharacterized protein n=1 Tax=Fasciola hepatica TaxID=6192 RepID=A0A4E0RMU5_FASHE|nr:hypothetical protein D915_010484 [Fasciola hepatica]
MRSFTICSFALVATLILHTVIGGSYSYGKGVYGIDYKYGKGIYGHGYKYGKGFYGHGSLEFAILRFGVMISTLLFVREWTHVEICN